LLHNGGFVIMSDIITIKKHIDISLYRYLFVVAIVVMAGFSCYKFVIGELISASFYLLLSLLFAFSLRQVLINNFTNTDKYIITTLCVGCFIFVVYSKSTLSTLFWLYPIITSLFFLFSARIAVTISAFLIIIAMSFGFAYLSYTQFFNLLFSMIFILISGYVISARTESYNNQFMKLVDIDPLTSLKNRRSLQRELLNEICMHKNNIHKSSLIILDLDYFKKVNDTYGHSMGDEVLIQFSELLKETVRETDGVYRYGGEEFIILAKNTRLVNAANLAEYLREITEKTLKVKDNPITVSIGVAEVRKEDSDAASWLDRADDALYKAKEKGRNVVYLARGKKAFQKYQPYYKEQHLRVSRAA